MATDGMTRLAETAAKMQRQQVEQLAAVLRRTPAAAADPNYFDVRDDETLDAAAEKIVEAAEALSGSPDEMKREVRNITTERLADAARSEAAAVSGTTTGTVAAPPTGAAATIAAIGALSVDLASPNTLDADSRSKIAKWMIVLAVVGFGVAVTGVVLDDADTDPGNMPVLCVVVALVAVIGAVLITLGYGTVRLGTGTTPSTPSSTTPTA